MGQSWEMACSEAVTGTERLFGSIHPPSHPSIPSQAFWSQQMLEWVTACFPSEGTALLMRGCEECSWHRGLSLVADGGKTQLKAESSADIPNRASTVALATEEGMMGEEDGIWCKFGRISRLFIPFWEWQQTPWLRGWQDCGTETRLPLAPSVLDWHWSGTAPHRLQSFTDLGRKMKAKNIQAVHEFPRKPILR